MQSHQGAVAVVDFPEQPDGESSDGSSMQRKITSLLLDTRVERLILDLRRVRFITSQTLGFLAGLHGRASRRNVAVSLVGSRETLGDVLRVTQLDRIYAVYATPDAAIAALAAG